MQLFYGPARDFFKLLRCLRAGVDRDGSLYYVNSWGELKYGGPNPIHYDAESYFFEFYALDAELDLVEVKEAMDAAAELPWIGASKAVFMKAIEGHVLALGELWGKYKEPTE